MFFLEFLLQTYQWEERQSILVRNHRLARSVQYHWRKSATPGYQTAQEFLWMVEYYTVYRRGRRFTYELQSPIQFIQGSRLGLMKTLVPFRRIRHFPSGGNAANTMRGFNGFDPTKLSATECKKAIHEMKADIDWRFRKQQRDVQVIEEVKGHIAYCDEKIKEQINLVD